MPAVSEKQMLLDALRDTKAALPFPGFHTMLMKRDSGGPGIVRYRSGMVGPALLSRSTGRETALHLYRYSAGPATVQLGRSPYSRTIADPLFTGIKSRSFIILYISNPRYKYGC